MLNTHFHDDYGFLVKGRAFSYLTRTPGGEYRSIALSFSNAGATSLFTTVEDLVRWDENFYSGKVGGKDLLAQMHVKGVLNNGTEIEYASGIELRQYRGLNVVEHAGGYAGFRSNIVRFPDQHFTAIALCNAAEAAPWLLTRTVADLYLAKELGAAPAANPPPKPVEVKIDPRLLDAYVGDYAITPEVLLSVTRNGDQLVGQATGQAPTIRVPASDNSFFPREFESLLIFDKAAPDGKSPAVTIRQNGRDTRAPRVERARPTAEQMEGYAGSYFSRELNTLYFVNVREGRLFVRSPRGELQLQPLTRDAFAGSWPIGHLASNAAPRAPAEVSRPATGAFVILFSRGSSCLGTRVARGREVRRNRGIP